MTEAIVRPSRVPINTASLELSTVRSVVVTGCTSGIGQALANHLAAQGNFVIGIGRDANKCAAAERDIKAKHPADLGRVVVADLSMLSEVRGAAADIQTELAIRGKSSLDALVNNAGVFSSWYSTTSEGFELQFAVNQLAPFALTHFLMPALFQSDSGRIVTISSGSHQGAKLRWHDLQRSRSYSGLAAYRSTKLMNLLFTLELSRRLQNASHLQAYAADPGLVATDMGFKGTDFLGKSIWSWRKRQGRAPEASAPGLAFLVNENPPPAWSLYWLDGKPIPPSRFAQDKRAASRLWKELERMTGLASSDYGLSENA
jgi:NAD(P)-dependent dehydrogenase (short-subunit alcohol dehydrogenase family)